MARMKTEGSQNKGKELLLEVGTEEIPAGFLPAAVRELTEGCGKRLSEERVAFSGVHGYGTPRRLVLYVERLADRQEDLDRVVLGPPRSAAFDADGNPTAAAAGFARGQGVAVEDLTVEETAKGPYVSARKREPGLPTRDLLRQLLPQLITSLHFPKSMRWGNGTLRFARPIHWILALYHEEVVPFELDGIKSGNLSRGHRFMSPGSFTVHRFKAYKTAARERFLMIDPDEREKEILRQIREVEEEVGGQVIPNPDLLREVVHLVEYPTVLCGRFEPGFLSLPRSVLMTAMREHQRYFSMENKEGELIPHFITVSNTRPKDPSVIVAGNERVLRARLSDALYFFKTDCARPLASYAEDLRSVTFQERLGSLFEKAQRLRGLTEWLARRVPAVDVEAVLRAALLCKADLCTEMVGEFPVLQGDMGREYALLSGESEAVARAVEEHYRPRFAGDGVPAGAEGAILSLADKIDTIAGCFGVGLVPSGSEDPYALRRQTLGVLAILLDKGYLVSVNEMIREALRLLTGKISRDPEEVRKEILDYFKGRLSGFLVSEGYRYDTVDAVLEAGLDPVPDARARVEALTAFRKNPLFEPFTVVCKRAMNIIEENTSSEVDRTLLGQESEKALYQAVLESEEKVQALIPEGKHEEALIEIASLRGAIDDFFDGVMVMDKDEKIRANRLALLTRIAGLVTRIADFSKIVVK